MKQPRWVRTVAIVQARMGSTRLPGKTLLDIGGATMLGRVVQRTALSRLVDGVLVATSQEPRDDPIEVECARLGVSVYRGSEQDVLDRYYRAARGCGAEAVIRITADCPLVDAGVIDRVIAAFWAERPDYASNVLVRTYPRGLDTEVVSAAALEVAWREASEPFQRTHVTPYFYQNPGRFRLVPVSHDVDLSRHRWTVDTDQDLRLVREVYRRMGNDGTFDWTQVLALLEREPWLAELNRLVQQKPLQEG